MKSIDFTTPRIKIISRQRETLQPIQRFSTSTQKFKCNDHLLLGYINPAVPAGESNSGQDYSAFLDLCGLRDRKDRSPWKPREGW